MKYYLIGLQTKSNKTICMQFLSNMVLSIITFPIARSRNHSEIRLYQFPLNGLTKIHTFTSKSICGRSEDGGPLTLVIQTE